MKEKVKLTRKELKKKHKSEIKGIEESNWLEIKDLERDIFSLIESEDEKLIQGIKDKWLLKRKRETESREFKRDLAKLVFFGNTRLVNDPTLRVMDSGHQPWELIDLSNPPMPDVIEPQTNKNIYELIEEAQVTIGLKHTTVRESDKVYLTLTKEDKERLINYYKDLYKDLYEKYIPSEISSIMTQFGELFIGPLPSMEFSFIKMNLKDRSVICKLGSNILTTILKTV